jgi:hypothetical protein
MLRTLLLAAVISTVGASAATASQCGPRTVIIELLAKNFEERPVAIGLSRNGRLLEILAREDGRTWTVIATSPQGVTCVLDAGEEWQVQQAMASGPEA